MNHAAGTEERRSRYYTRFNTNGTPRGLSASGQPFEKTSLILNLKALEPEKAFEKQ
jgi:hypothetical protein